MPEYRYAYALTLNLAFPNTNAPKDFDSGDIEKQIHEAENIFNARFEGRKQISIYEIEDQSISIYLSISYVPANATREVSAFSQILVKEYQFDKYSSKQGRLFNAHVKSLPDKDDSPVLEEDIIRAEEMAREEAIRQEDENTYIEHMTDMRKRPSARMENTFVKMTNEILATDNIDELDNYIQQLQNLTSIVNAKKDIMIRSKK